MKFSFLVTAALSVGLMPRLSLGQPLYVWCPAPQVLHLRAEFLVNQRVDLIVYDGRATLGSQAICASTAMLDTLSSYISRTYPFASVRSLPGSAYFGSEEAGRITIKVAVAAYQAGLGRKVTTAMGEVGGLFPYERVPTDSWNGLTSYYVQILDRRSDRVAKYEHDIVELASKPGNLGYRSAEACLQVSYATANQALLSFIDRSLTN